MAAFAFSMTSLRSRSPPGGVARYASAPRTRTSTSPTSDSPPIASRRSHLCRRGLRLGTPLLDVDAANNAPFPEKGCLPIAKGAVPRPEPAASTWGPVRLAWVRSLLEGLSDGNVEDARALGGSGAGPSLSEPKATGPRRVTERRGGRLSHRQGWPDVQTVAEVQSDRADRGAVPDPSADGEQHLVTKGFGTNVLAGDEARVDEHSQYERAGETVACLERGLEQAVPANRHGVARGRGPGPWHDELGGEPAVVEAAHAVSAGEEARDDGAGGVVSAAGNERPHLQPGSERQLVPFEERHVAANFGDDAEVPEAPAQHSAALLQRQGRVVAAVGLLADISVSPLDELLCIGEHAILGAPEEQRRCGAGQLCCSGLEPVELEVVAGRDGEMECQRVR